MKILIIKFLSLIVCLKCFQIKRKLNLTNFYNDKFEIYGGYLPVSELNKSQMFYQLVIAKNNSFVNKKPLILWLQGGPGCSDFSGFGLEFGPFLLNETKLGNHNVFTVNENSWANDYNLLFIDQPIGVGYSLLIDEPVPNNTITSGKQFQYFLEEFYKEFNQFSYNEFYIFGESYGGHYVPDFAANLIKNNIRVDGFIFFFILIKSFFYFQ